MGTYGIPRNTKGEGRILYIFSYKALMYTAIGAGIGLILYFILRTIHLSVVGIVLIILFGIIGFSIGTFKIPDSNGFQLGKKVGGENIDEVIRRAIKFNMNKNKIYTYTKEDTKDE